MAEPSKKLLGWRLFDAIVADAPLAEVNPWEGGTFRPDYETLRRLLAVPVYLNANSQSGVPALAFDVWVSYELRRAGFDSDKVWPRPSEPRVMPTEIGRILGKGVVNKDVRDELVKKMKKGLGGAVSANAKLLGKNYVKQVDVVISAWHTGPELMISTKRMDSSFGKNAANRVEESYGDAKNLRLRHPQAALGFVYGLNANAFVVEKDRADWLVDLLAKLGREDDAYDAVALVVPRWSGPVVDDEESSDDEAPIDPLDTTESGDVIDESEDFDEDAVVELEVDEELDMLPTIELDHELVPADLDPGRFFSIMVERVLAASPINFHVEARERRASGA